MGRKSRSRLAADWFAKLRINAQTQEVEHSDVSDVKEEVDTSVSSDLATLDSDKADATYVASEMAKLDSEKADLSYVNTAIANATMADSDILSAVKRVDGSGSGLDADTLDGKQASSFAAYNSSTSSTGALSLPKGTTSQRTTAFAGAIRFNTSNDQVEWRASASGDWHAIKKAPINVDNNACGWRRRRKSIQRIK